MGMYDEVKFKIDCPYCGEPAGLFQSKDGNCTLDILKPEEVDWCYGHCKNCGRHLEYFFEKPESRIKVRDTRYGDVIGYVEMGTSEFIPKD